MRLPSILLAALLAVACNGGGKLTCSYSSADISTTEEEHVVLAGFAARNALSDGIHQHLYTHCLVLGDGTQKVCIISNDLMEISPAISDTIRTMIAEKSGLALDNILMHNIHTHSAPRSGGSSVVTGGTNRAWKERMVATVVDNAVKTIGAKGEPFTLEIGKGQTSINGNRCEKEGPVDHDVYVARFFQHGKPLVSIVNLACHPVCMGPGSYLLSSDYAGVNARYLSEAWGGEVFQLTGAAGNMDPAQGPKRVEYAEQCGKELADALKDIPFEKVPSKGLLRLVNETVDLPYQIAEVTPEAVIRHADSLAASARTTFPRFADDVMGWKDEILKRFAEGPVPSKLRYHLHGLDVDGILFFFSDGEPFCEYQMEARASFPDRTVFFAGYTNGQNSYLPSEHAYQVRKGYEYEIEQMHVYIKAPYPLSERMPSTYREGVLRTIRETIESE
ncbi:MAG: neutral/alkaline non-lysosomal ceramidase N-terminal domain-containing protein [Bacteroidales bacterium]|nr:neutral/alkaline non-lysosomal ceramidase N-terminal domain-containing protein [Bacteroidales bacterium]